MVKVFAFIYITVDFSLNVVVIMNNISEFLAKAVPQDEFERFFRRIKSAFIILSVLV